MGLLPILPCVPWLSFRSFRALTSIDSRPQIGARGTPYIGTFGLPVIPSAASIHLRGQLFAPPHPGSLVVPDLSVLRVCHRAAKLSPGLPFIV